MRCMIQKCVCLCLCVRVRVCVCGAVHGVTSARYVYTFSLTVRFIGNRVHGHSQHLLTVTYSSILLLGKIESYRGKITQGHSGGQEDIVTFQQTCQVFQQLHNRSISTDLSTFSTQTCHFFQLFQHRLVNFSSSQQLPTALTTDFGNLC